MAGLANCHCSENTIAALLLRLVRTGSIEGGGRRSSRWGSSGENRRRGEPVPIENSVESTSLSTSMICGNESKAGSFPQRDRAGAVGPGTFGKAQVGGVTEKIRKTPQARATHLRDVMRTKPAGRCLSCDHLDVFGSANEPSRFSRWHRMSKYIALSSMNAMLH